MISALKYRRNLRAEKSDLLKTKKKMKWYVLTGIIVGGGATIAGLGWYFLGNRKKSGAGADAGSSEGNSFDEGDSKTSSNSIYAPPKTTTSSGFPLKSGSKGIFVENLQNALIKKYGAGILPKYGADKKWGTEMTKALTDKGLKTVIDQTTYTDYITGNFSGTPSGTTPDNSPAPNNDGNPFTQIGRDIRTAAQAFDIGKTVAALQKIKSVTQYQAASVGFKEEDLRDGTTFTIVNGLLTQFIDENEKALLRKEFVRIGLKEHKSSDSNPDKSTWTLTGLGEDHRQLRTRMEAIITDGHNIMLHVPARTLLGQWLGSGNGYTRFRTLDGRDMYIRTNAVVFA
jgi:hypothetical protein